MYFRETQPRALLAQLREGTRREHERLEAELDLSRSDLTLDAYGTILRRFYGFYLPWEKWLGEHAEGLLPDLAARLVKVGLLAADLQYLGVDLKSLPICPDVPRPRSAAGLLGGMYVTEGATLGGQLISRHLRRRSLVGDGGGDAFFCSYRERVGPMWKAFGDGLLRHAGVDEEEVVESARQMFVALDRWLVEGVDGHGSAAARPDDL